MATVTDVEREFLEDILQSIVEDPVKASISDLRFAYFIAALNGDLPSGGGDVDSVNGKTGTVVLSAEDVDAVGTSTTIDDPATQTWADMDIIADGSDSSNWPDRFKVTFTGSGGAATRETFFLNEYGEIRGTPALDNSVAARWFAAMSDAAFNARSDTKPVIEIMDKRSGTRTSLFAVNKHGHVSFKRLVMDEDRTPAASDAPWISESLTVSLENLGDVVDHLRILINGTKKMWLNEWGALRGTSPYDWGDALVRAIRMDGDGITTPTQAALELVDRRTGAPNNVMWGVRWADGVMVQGDQPVGAVYTLEASEDANDIPATLPAGTLIVRKTA